VSPRHICASVGKKNLLLEGGRISNPGNRVKMKSVLLLEGQLVDRGFRGGHQSARSHAFFPAGRACGRATSSTNTLDLFKSLRKPGTTLGGASSAAQEASHRSGDSEKCV
jgi:hypothetical protein